MHVHQALTLNWLGCQNQRLTVYTVMPFANLDWTTNLQTSVVELRLLPSALARGN